MKMNLKVIIGALRAGQELPHTTGVKWAGIAFTGVSLALTALSGVALSHGWIQAEIPPENIYELSSLLVSAVLSVLGYLQIATSTRVGIPAGRGNHDAESDGMHAQSVSTNTNKPNGQDSGALPGGPFFGGD